MEEIKERIDRLDWPTISLNLHDNGFVVVPQVLQEHECEDLKQRYSSEDKASFRKTIRMERYRFGIGEYKYYNYPLPETIARLRESVYPHLVPVANQWMRELGLKIQFPDSHAEMQALCRQNNQTKPTALILKYGKGGFNTLHQDLYGEVYFPIQVVFMLDQIGEDYQGGEFVITEQIPRAQSKANVLKPGKGDMVIFTTQSRPCKGTRGYYRINMRHGVSPVHSGSRYSMGIIFHDALS